MPDIVLHPSTESQLRSFLSRPSHALLLTGQSGIGKTFTANWLVAQLLKIPVEQIESQPYVHTVLPDKPRSISIEVIRNLEQFLRLKVPGDSTRVVLISDANLLTEQAQNALLKTLEEPPAGTILVLTSPNDQALLPTIRSRVQTVELRRPSMTTLSEHFQSKGYASAQIEQTSRIAGGLPGLMDAMLSGDEEHPLVQATNTARQLLQQSTFERLAQVDVLSKQKELSINVLQIMQQMAHLALGNPKLAEPATKRWQHILTTSYQAIDQLSRNGQAKLVLSNFMLNL